MELFLVLLGQFRTSCFLVSMEIKRLSLVKKLICWWACVKSRCLLLIKFEKQKQSKTIYEATRDKAVGFFFLLTHLKKYKRSFEVLQIVPTVQIL